MPALTIRILGQTLQLPSKCFTGPELGNWVFFDPITITITITALKFFPITITITKFFFQCNCNYNYKSITIQLHFKYNPITL